MEGRDSVIIVDGEAPESSDEDIESFSRFGIPIAQAQEVSESGESSMSKSIGSRSFENEFPSAYHKKLFQKNVDLWTHMNGLLITAIENSSKNIIATDQMMLRSQITLQSVSQTTKKVNTTLEMVMGRIRGVLGANFLPAVSSPPPTTTTHTRSQQP